MPDAEIDVPSDTAVSMTMVADSVTVKKPGLIQRVIDYFTDANKEHPDKAFDISFIGGPEYSSETGFGVGIIGSGLYTAGKQWRTDTVTPKSNVSLKFEVATHQYYKGGAEGIHIFPKDRMRLIYDTYFYYIQNSDKSTKYRAIGQIIGPYPFRIHFVRALLWRGGERLGRTDGVGRCRNARDGEMLRACQ